MQPPNREPAGPVRERPGLSVGASRLAAHPWTRAIGLSLAAALFLAFSGAFNTGQAPIGIRLAYWVAVILAGTLCGTLASFLVERGPLQSSPVIQGLAVFAILTPPLVVLIWLITGLTLGNGRPEISNMADFILPVVLITAAMTALNYVVQRQPAQTHAAPAGSGPPRFLQRFPARLKGAELYAVSAEDHYLRLHTSRGQDLILFRLADAIAELEGLEGAQTHRSWWVSRAAIAEIRRGEGRVDLVLKSGASVPVSRRNLKSLRDLGWF
ncbi:MAG: LytTR family transcriptional regulator [Caulobacteraceae bacterium]|nr:LytTR family transcriptional regulator [Caulobacteraceae bacterium]